MASLNITLCEVSSLNKDWYYYYYIIPCQSENQFPDNLFPYQPCSLPAMTVLTCCYKINFVEPPSITNISGNQTVIVGKDVTTLNLYCTAVGKPPPNVTWIKVSDNRNVTFPLNISGEEEEGTYRCTADNGVGNSVTRDVFITVLGKFSLFCEPLAFSFVCGVANK